MQKILANRQRNCLVVVVVVVGCGGGGGGGHSYGGNFEKSNSWLYHYGHVCESEN